MSRFLYATSVRDKCSDVLLVCRSLYFSISMNVLLQYSTMVNIKRKVILTQLVVELIISGSFFHICRFFRPYISGTFTHILSIFTGVYFKGKFKINVPKIDISYYC